MLSASFYLVLLYTLFVEWTNQIAQNKVDKSLINIEFGLLNTKGIFKGQATSLFSEDTVSCMSLKTGERDGRVGQLVPNCEQVIVGLPCVQYKQCLFSRH